MKNAVLSTKRKLGYASGIVSESVLYNMFYTFFIVFLTDTAGIRPGLAGTIALVSVSWDGITDPLIGHIVDRRGLDKRRVIVRAAIPMGVLFIAAFSPVSFGETGRFLYYMTVTMLFWAAYTAVTVPYYALGAEITRDYNERTNIRGISSFINCFAILIGGGVPIMIVEWLAKNGLAERWGWMGTSALMAVIAVVFAFLAVRSIRSVSLIGDRAFSQSVVSTYLTVLRLKPMKFYLVFVFFFLMSSSMITGNLPYLVEHLAGADPDAVTIVLIVVVGTMLAFVPVVTWAANRFDRKIALIFAFACGIFGLFFLKILGITSLARVILLAVFAGIALAGFWTMFYTLAYDICEIDEYLNGTRREGVITALPQLVQKIGSALGLWLVGFMLEKGGYDAAFAQQSEKALLSMENTGTLLAGALMSAALAAVLFYPVTKARFRKLEAELARKKAGAVPDTTGLEKLL